MRNPKIDHAERQLHEALESITVPSNMVCFGVPKVEWGSRDNILKALRAIVEAGGNPFDDKEFKSYFNFLTSFLETFRYKEGAPEYNEYIEKQKFVRTVVRICGGEYQKDGTIKYVRNPRSKPNTD
jgi:hypothetical protein